MQLKELTISSHDMKSILEIVSDDIKSFLEIVNREDYLKLIEPSYHHFMENCKES